MPGFAIGLVVAEFGPSRSPKPADGDHRNRTWRSPKAGIPITETGDGDRLTSVVRPLLDLRWRALTGHVTEEMQRHYSTVGMDEKQAAVAGVLKLVPAPEDLAINEERLPIDLKVAQPASSSKGGTKGGTEPKAKGRSTTPGSNPQRPSAANSSTCLERDNGFEPSTFSLGS